MHSIESRILVVDDDPTVAEVVTGYLERAGHAVDLAVDGPAALRAAAARRPDLVVLDLMLPGMDGLEVCRRLRATAPVPVIMLTARGDEDDRILGLEIGADDYVTKPFSPRELVLRVESVLRRARAAVARPGPPVSRSGITLDPAARTAAKDGRELALTLREFDLLAYLLDRPGEAITRERLMHEVWGWEFGDLSTVTVHVRRLRGKIESDPAKPALIRTVWGVGYRFEAESQTAAGPTTGMGAGPAADVAVVADVGVAPDVTVPASASVTGTSGVEPSGAGTVDASASAAGRSGIEQRGAGLGEAGLTGAGSGAAGLNGAGRGAAVATDAVATRAALTGAVSTGAGPNGVGPSGVGPVGVGPVGPLGPVGVGPGEAAPRRAGLDIGLRQGVGHG
ncbi:response regulator transcription factor [Streptomyces xanthochromogenes]|uniref:response regulator transcription factor n=1 Tax=Streptomyces xanthochromogenes TaxID=67384 RepID=UPI003F4DBA66